MTAGSLVRAFSTGGGRVSCPPLDTLSGDRFEDLGGTRFWSPSLFRHVGTSVERGDTGPCVEGKETYPSGFVRRCKSAFTVDTPSGETTDSDVLGKLWGGSKPRPNSPSGYRKKKNKKKPRKD